MISTAKDRIRDVAAIVADLERRGVVLRVSGDSIDYEAPRGVLTIADLGTLLKRKPALLAYLSSPKPSDDLDSQRWGPGLDDVEPGISVPADRWDWAVARWPHAWWLAWHKLVTELTP